MSETPVEVVAEEVPVELQPREGDVEETDQPEVKAEEVKVEPKEEEPKKTHDQRRWERLLKERAEFKAKVDLYEHMNQQKQTAPAQTDKRPSRAAYDNDEDYVDALTDWKVESKLANVEQRLSQTQAQTQTQASWNSKISQARSEYADYEAVMEDAQDIPIQPAVAEAIQSSDLGADIAYYLGKNPGEAERLNSLSPMAAAREIGRIESYVEFEKGQAKEVKKAAVSKAPAPIKPVRSTSGSGTKSLEDMSPAEYMAYMNKREQTRGKRR